MSKSADQSNLEKIKSHTSTFIHLSQAEPETLEEWAAIHLQRVWSVSRGSNTYWKSRLPRWSEVAKKEKGITAILKNLPVMTRQEIQSFSDFLPVWIPGSSFNEYGSAVSSGSTGKPVRVVKHAPTYNPYIRATTALDDIWQGRDPSATKITIRAQGSREAASNQNHDQNSHTSSRLEFVLRAKEMSFAEILVFLAKHPGSNVSCNATLMRLLAHQQLSSPIEGIEIAHFTNWAESLSPETRELIKTTFRTRVSDRYSTEELGLLAIQCHSADHLHALQFLNFIEIIDDFGNSCEMGQPGRVVVTALHNQSQPLIRYEVGDIASWGEPCEFGIQLPVFSPLITRKRETFTDPQGRIVQPNATGCKLAKDLAVTDFQILKFLNGLVVLYTGNSPLTESQKEIYEKDLLMRFSMSGTVDFLQLSQVSSFKQLKRRDFVPFEEQKPSQISEQVIANWIQAATS